MSTSAPRSVLKGRWYYLATICSMGLLAWLPFVHAASHLRRRSVSRLVWRYAVAAVVILILLVAAPTDERGEIAAGWGDAFAGAALLAIMATMGVGCVQQAQLRREIYGGAPPPEQDVLDPALASALEARQRRANAREIAERDPLLARDLKIGRPDLPRSFDDGGLVDLNSAPAEVVAETCGLSRATAEHLVAARPPGGFLAVNDVFSLAEIPVSAWDIVRDRAVVVPRPD